MCLNCQASTVRTAARQPIAALTPPMMMSDGVHIDEAVDDGEPYGNIVFAVVSISYIGNYP